MNVNIGGWGVGTRPGNRFVSSVRAYARCLCLVRSGSNSEAPPFSLFPFWLAGLSLFPFWLAGLSLFPFLPRAFPFSLVDLQTKVSPSETKRDHVKPSESRGIQVSPTESM